MLICFQSSSGIIQDVRVVVLLALIHMASKANKELAAAAALVSFIHFIITIFKECTFALTDCRHKQGYGRRRHE